MPTVYGTLLNDRATLAALGEAVHQPPYKAPPRAPVLYIKPRNTIAADGDAVCLSPDADELEVGASLGLVIGRVACRVSVDAALDVVGGYVVVNDVSVPHASYYRPALRLKCRDGYCPIGTPVARDVVADPNALEIRVEIDGVERQRASTATLVRPIAQLLADVTEFMTLHPGDVLMVGVPAGAPRVRAGQTSRITIEGVGTLTNRYVEFEAGS